MMGEFKSILYSNYEDRQKVLISGNCTDYTQYCIICAEIQLLRQMLELLEKIENGEEMDGD